jgi:hypothetical protein
VDEVLRAVGLAPPGRPRSHDGHGMADDGIKQVALGVVHRLVRLSTAGGVGSAGAFSQISPHFRSRRHLMAASEYRAEMTVRFAIWDRITGVTTLPTTA